MPRLTFEEIEKRIMAMPRFQDVGSRAARFGVDQIREFCAAAGNPEQGFKSIHVAGTNGKGTVCSILASVLTEQGYRTGLYTSPHLTDVRERFRINGEMMPKEVLIDFFERHDALLKKYPLTFFELTTVIAFWWFSREKVDAAVIETGLGGRLDATNILDPMVSVITSIGMDHTEQLGDSIESIAFEKAGILKPGKPFVCGVLSPEALNVIHHHAENVDAIRSRPGIEVFEPAINEFEICGVREITGLRPDLSTPCLRTNIKIAVETFEAIRDEMPVSDLAIKSGIGRVKVNSGLSGRFEQLLGDRAWYFDGGHNQQAMASVRTHLTGLFPDRQPVVVLTMMADKFTAEVIEVLRQYRHIWYYELQVPRVLKSRDFQSLFPDSGFVPDDQAARISLLKYLKTEVVLFTGSFYFYSTVSEWMESLSLDSNCAKKSPSTKNQIAKN